MSDATSAYVFIHFVVYVCMRTYSHNATSAFILSTQLRVRESRGELERIAFVAGEE